VAENASLLAKEAGLIARIVELEQKMLSLRLESRNWNRSSYKMIFFPILVHPNSSFISPEDKEVDDFVDLKVKERVSNEIRDRNREKKLQRESAGNQTQDLSQFHEITSEIWSHNPKLIIIQEPFPRGTIKVM